MRASVILAVPRDAESWLGAMIASCQPACAALDVELVVARERATPAGEDFRQLPGVRHVPGGSGGLAAAKARGARHAIGDSLILLEGPARPEPGSIEQLIRDVEFTEGRALITPRFLALDLARWQVTSQAPGHLGFLDLETFDRGWSRLPTDRHWYHYYATPAALGGGLALSRLLYEDLGGYDPELLVAGLEDVDLSLRCWLAGRTVLHDPMAAIGHGFRAGYDPTPDPGRVLADELRLARKLFGEAGWSDWTNRAERRHAGATWTAAWRHFEERRESVEAAREALEAGRVRDVSWYAAAFGLDWPAIGPRAEVTAAQFIAALPEAAAAGTPEACRRGRTGRACFEDHCRQPRHALILPGVNLVGRLEAVGGDPIAFGVELGRWPGGEVVVARACFQGGGDAGERAYLSLLTEWIEGRPLAAVRALGAADLQRVFETDGVPVPAAERAIAALRRTLDGF